ncbi:hypothetical protein DSO57_1005618 [Entomophthora muscae]|uniref:Uncharacterized protein n=1 Tax=Entomophthora muscae TaxID=34485 RepID=A0ACC2RML0_9FUNG|nr:hypothetical protein DSO57_1005618 [Entomophthora muscae]
MTKSIKHLHSSVPEYVCERLQEFHQLQQPWQAQVDSALNTHRSEFEQLVIQLNEFCVHLAEQLHHLAEVASIRLQAHKNGLSQLSTGGHPYEDLVRQEKELWDAINDLCATTRSQDPLEAALQQEILELQAAVAESTSLPGPSEDKGCCPGMSGNPVSIVLEN